MPERITAVGENTTLADRKRRAGQRLVVGFYGEAVTDDVRALVREIQPAGFILFARNVVEPAQVLELNRELTSLIDVSRPPILSVDQEGGRVQRIREPATRWPPMRHVGNASAEGQPDLTAEVSRVLALELRAMGFNLNFAPVADVDSNPNNPVIGDRSFGRDPKQVAREMTAFIRAHQAAGIVACAKHFPGHGDTSVDSHLDLPIVEREEPDLRQTELVPFRASVAAGVGSVMTAHVVYPAWDPDNPATMSPAIQRDILRGELGFNGLLFSDDLDMKAVRGRYDIEEQLSRSTEATVDVFLCCNTIDLQWEAYQALVKGQEDHPDFQRNTSDSVARVQALRDRFFHSQPPLPDLSLVGQESHRDLVRRIVSTGQS